MKKILFFLCFLYFPFSTFSAQSDIDYQKIKGNIFRPIKLKKENDECFILFTGKINYCFSSAHNELLEIKNIPYAPLTFITYQEGNMLVGVDYFGNWWVSRLNENLEVILNKKIKSFSSILEVRKYKDQYLMIGFDLNKKAKISIFDRYLNFKKEWVLNNTLKVVSMPVIDLNDHELIFRINSSNAGSSMLVFNEDLSVKSEKKIDNFLGKTFKIKEEYHSGYFNGNDFYIEKYLFGNNVIKEKIKSFAPDSPDSSGLELFNNNFYYYWVENGKKISWKKIDISNSNVLEEKSIDVDGVLDPRILFFSNNKEVMLKGLIKKGNDDYIFSISIEK